MRKRIKKKRYKILWWTSLGATKCGRVFRPVVVNGKARPHAFAALKYKRPSELHAEEFDSDLIPVRFFYCGT